MDNFTINQEAEKILAVAEELNTTGMGGALIEEIQLIENRIRNNEQVDFVKKATAASIDTGKQIRTFVKAVESHTEATNSIKEALSSLSIGEDVQTGLESLKEGITNALKSLTALQSEESIIQGKRTQLLIEQNKKDILKLEERVLNAIVTLKDNTVVEIPDQVQVPVIPSGSKKVDRVIPVELYSNGRPASLGGGGGITAGGSSAPSTSHSDIVMLDEANNTTYILRTLDDGAGIITTQTLDATGLAPYTPTTPGSLEQPTRLVKSGIAIIGAPLATQTWDSNTITGDIVSVAVNVLAVTNDAIANTSTISVITSDGTTNWILPVNSTMEWSVIQDRDTKLDRIRVVTTSASDRAVISYSYSV